MKKVKLLVAMLAMGLVAAAPALAQTAFEIGDSEVESGDVATETKVATEGNNNSACASLPQFGNSGNATNQQGDLQDKSKTDDQEFAGQSIELTPEQEQECEQKIQQAAAASSGKAETKEEKKEEKKKEEKKELPKTGGSGSASLLALGAGALLVGGGLLARRFVR